MKWRVYPVMAAYDRFWAAKSPQGKAALFGCLGDAVDWCYLSPQQRWRRSHRYHVNKYQREYMRRRRAKK